MSMIRASQRVLLICAVLVLNLKGTIAMAQDDARAAVWTAPVHVTDLSCVDAVYVYYRQAEGRLDYLRAEPQLSACPTDETETSPPPPAPATEPAPPAEAYTFRKSAWIWETGLWREDPSGLLQRASDGGYDRLFIALEIEDGVVAHQDALAAFIRSGLAQGVEVLAVEGDPRMVTPEGLEYALGRARAIAAYNEARPEAPLAGLQYDIEPYLLEIYKADPAGVLEKWSAAITALSAAYGDRVGAVIPFWMPAAPGGMPALTAASPSIRSLTAMAYRTDPDAIVSAASGVLAAGQELGLPVNVALEAGPLEDEYLFVYRRSPSGELLLSPDQGPEQTVSLFSDAVHPQGDAAAFSYSHSVTAPASRVSFLGDGEALEAALNETRARLAAHPSFAGIALHGVF